MTSDDTERHEALAKIIDPGAWRPPFLRADMHRRAASRDAADRVLIWLATQAAQPVAVTADELRAALSTWLTLALDHRSEGPTTLDLLTLRDWIDEGTPGPPPTPGDPTPPT